MDDQLILIIEKHNKVEYVNFQGETLPPPSHRVHHSGWVLLPNDRGMHRPAMYSTDPESCHILRGNCILTSMFPNSFRYNSLRPIEQVYVSPQTKEILFTDSRDCSIYRVSPSCSLEELVSFQGSTLDLSRNWCLWQNRYVVYYRTGFLTFYDLVTSSSVSEPLQLPISSYKTCLFSHHSYLYLTIGKCLYRF
jgi:hypothetical protein